MGGRDVMANVEKGDIEVDGWCVVGMRGVTPKGQTVGWRNKGEGQKGNRPLKSQTKTNRSLLLSLHDQMKTKSRRLPLKTRKVGHHPYIYLPVFMTK
jgi:hypothetical protein